MSYGKPLSKVVHENIMHSSHSIFFIIFIIAFKRVFVVITTMFTLQFHFRIVSKCFAIYNDACYEKKKKTMQNNNNNKKKLTNKKSGW